MLVACIIIVYKKEVHLIIPFDLYSLNENHAEINAANVTLLMRKTILFNLSRNDSDL